VTQPRVIRLEDLLGSRVVAANGRPVGHIEEVRAERRGAEHQIVAFVLGTGGLFERWSLTANLSRKGRKRIARWNQLDINDPSHPRLTCPLEEIEEEV